jgi:RNA polymerase sigma-70 factor, ECF subfamily
MLGLQEATFESTFTTNHGALLRRLTSLTRDPEVAADLAQEAFVRLAREVEAGRSPESPAAWLHAVAGNLVRSWGRHRSVVERRSTEIQLRPAFGDPETALLRDERARAMQRFLAELTSCERTALLLAAEGYTGLEIADRIGRSPGATRTLMCRARQRVRDLVAAEEDSAA